jgi:hypothetical protein
MAKEGVRPNVVQDFSGGARRGTAITASLLIKEMPFDLGPVADELFTPAFIREAATAADGSFVDGDKTKMEGEPAFWFINQGKVERASAKIAYRCITLVFLHDGTWLQWQLMAGVPLGLEERLLEEFNRLVPTFWRVANSMVLLNKWDQVSRHQDHAGSGATLWHSPDGRYAARFPRVPEMVGASMGGGSSVGFRSLEEFDDGFIQYLVVVTTIEALTERPSHGQRRQLVEDSAREFLKAIGAGASRPEQRWSSFGAADEKWEVRAHFNKDGAPLVSEGFFWLDGTRMIRVGLTYPQGLKQAHASQARQFLTTFVALDGPGVVPTTESIAASVSARLGGTLFPCPQVLVDGAKMQLTKQGGTLRGATCRALTSEALGVVKQLDRHLSATRVKTSAGGWKSTKIGRVLIANYEGDGMFWWVFPAAQMDPGMAPAGAVSVLFIQWFWID